MTKGQFRILMVLAVVFGLLGSAVFSLLLHGAPALAQGTAIAVQDEVRAKSFVLVDDEGKVRAALGILADGGPVLDLYDTKRNRRAGLSLLADGTPRLDLYDAAGKLRAGLGLLTDGGPLLGLGDAAGKLRAGLGLDADGYDGLVLCDTVGKKRAALSLLADGRPGLTLWDAAGAERALVGCDETVNKTTGATTEYPESTLTLFKPDGTVLWQAP